MKKLFYLLFLMPLAFLASCNNDDNFPQVDITVTMSNVYQDSEKGTFYYVESEETEAPVIDGISAKSLIEGKEAVATNVIYTLNHIVRLFGTEENPWSATIPVEMLREGENVVNIAANILQVDKSIASCFVNVPFIVVDSVDDLPENIGQMGTYQVTLRMAKEK